MSRIYVASLSDYNAGILHGEWFEVTDADTMRDEINAMLEKSPTAAAEGQPAEEWAIHDYEGFGEMHLSESESFETICTIANGIDEYGEAFLAWADRQSGDDYDGDEFREAFHGEWESLADYVEDYWEQSGEMPKAPDNCWWHPANYIDWERMAHDLEINGEVWTAAASHGKQWVFSNR